MVVDKRRCRKIENKKVPLGRRGTHSHSRRGRYCASSTASGLVSLSRLSQTSTVVPESIIRVGLQYLHFAASQAEVTTGQILRVDVGRKSEVCGAAAKEGGEQMTMELRR